MSFSGIVKVGSISDLITIPAGAVATWSHGNGEKAILVEAVNGQGASNIDPLVVISQPDVNNIVVTNGAAGGITVHIRATFEDGTIGEGDVFPANVVAVV